MKGYFFLLAAAVIPSRVNAAPRADASNERPPYTAEQLGLVRDTTELRIHPNGCELAFATDITEALELWTVSACSFGTRSLPGAPAWPEQISSLRERVSDIRFSPDGTKILFASDAGGDERRDLFLADLRDGTVQRLTQTPMSESQPEFDPQGSRIAYLADPGQPFLFQLFVMDLAGRRSRQLTDEALSLTRPIWSRDGRWIAATRTGDDRHGDLLIIDAASGKYQAVPPAVKNGIIFADEFSPDDQHILCSATNDSGFMQLALVAAPTGGKIRLFGAGDWDVTQARYHAKTGIFFVRNENGRSALYHSASPAASPERIFGPSGNIRTFDLDRAGTRLAYLWTDASHPADAWVMDLDKRARVRLTRGATQGVDSESLSRPSWLSYPSFDGTTIHALYYPPRVRSLGAPPPAVVAVHGGPDLQTLDEFDPLLQLFAENGFAVLAPNYRGSIGYGRKFEDLNKKDWGGGDLKDLFAGAQYLASQNAADIKRLGITGESYGGYMTLMALAKSSDVWSAGVELYGMPDLVQDYELTKDRDGKWYETQMGTPLTDPDLFKDRSPITWLANIKTPLLIFQGANDTDVPRAESDMIYAKLLERKVPVGLIVYPNEGHGFTRRRNLTDYYRRTVEFFEKKLAAPTGTMRSAPQERQDSLPAAPTGTMRSAPRERQDSLPAAPAASTSKPG